MKDNLNAIRLCLATLVLFSHSFAMLGVPQPGLFGWTLGSHAVNAFFAVSGYLVIGSYMRRPDIVQFGLNRALRIVPALLVAVAFGRALYGWHGQYAGNPLPFRPNNSLWTIPWEITCYGACAVAGMIGLLHHSRYNVVFAVVWVMVLAASGSGDGSYALILPMLLSFLTGGFITVYERQMDVAVAAAISAAAFAGLLIGKWLELLPRVLYFVPDLSEVRLATIQQWLIIVITAVCTIYLGKYAPPRLVLREDYSYGVYLFAWPIQQVVVATALPIGWALNPYSLAAAAILLTFCVAAVSWHVIEKPALRLKRWGPRASSALRRMGRHPTLDTSPFTGQPGLREQHLARSDRHSDR